MPEVTAQHYAPSHATSIVQHITSAAASVSLCSVHASASSLSKLNHTTVRCVERQLHKAAVTHLQTLRDS